MQFAEVLRTLEKAGTAQTRKTYARHGIGPNMYGVSYAFLGALAKKIKTNQPLAEELWKTGNHDCCALALKIADPTTVKKSTLVAWGKTPGNHCVCGDMGKFVAATPYAVELSSKWCASKNILEQQLGWTTIAALAVAAEDDELDELFATCLAAIEAQIDAAANYTRYTMNNALIAIGGRNEPLKKLALAAAKRIGQVEVDHGDTSCKTPDAVTYIQKIWARKKK
jgi:3-methyladenine DNA glycosylase AlkD